MKSDLDQDISLSKPLMLSETFKKNHFNIFKTND